MAEAFVGLGGQRIFPFFPPPCAECRWRAQQRCSGPQTVQSQIENQQKLLSCFEPERTAVLLDNLDRFRPSTLPAFGIIEGLPASIPVLCEGMPSDLRLDPSTLYGIALDDLLDDNGRIGYDSARHLREAFRLPADGRLCLLGSVRDAPLEAMWHRSSVDGIWRASRASASNSSPALPSAYSRNIPATASSSA